MVCDTGMVASTMVSLFMNGVCCAWTMHGEEELRENIRRDVRLECRRQKFYEQEIRWNENHTLSEHDDQLAEDQHNSDSTLQEERRKKFIKSKMMAIQTKESFDQVRSQTNAPSAGGAEPRGRADSSASSMEPILDISSRDGPPSSFSKKDLLFRSLDHMNRNYNCHDHLCHHRPTVSHTDPKKMASLFDFCSDEGNEEEEESLEEITLNSNE